MCINIYISYSIIEQILYEREAKLLESPLNTRALVSRDESAGRGDQKSKCFPMWHSLENINYLFNLINFCLWQTNPCIFVRFHQCGLILISVQLSLHFFLVGIFF